MEVVPFSKEDQHKTEAFLQSIFDEMGWKDRGGELNDIYNYFHLPNDGFFLLAKHEGKIIGTAGCYKLTNNEGLMKRFYVHELHRGTEVAKKLLDTFLETARSMKLSRLVLDVSKDNTRAIGFYKKSGFAKYDQKPVDGWFESFHPEDLDYYFLEI